MIYQALIAVAAETWSGADDRDFATNPEYLRGQVELICTAMGWTTEHGWGVEKDIRRAVKK